MASPHLELGGVHERLNPSLLDAAHERFHVRIPLLGVMVEKKAPQGRRLSCRESPVQPESVGMRVKHSQHRQRGRSLSPGDHKLIAMRTQLVCPPDWIDNSPLLLLGLN